METALGVHPAVLEGVTGTEVTLSVTEGKHRMVRRMLANVGHPVVALKRLSFGALRLDALEPGAHRPATGAEEQWARSLLQGS